MNSHAQTSNHQKANNWNLPIRQLYQKRNQPEDLSRGFTDQSTNFKSDYQGLGVCNTSISDTKSQPLSLDGFVPFISQTVVKTESDNQQNQSQTENFSAESVNERESVLDDNYSMNTETLKVMFNTQSNLSSTTHNNEDFINSYSEYGLKETNQPLYIPHYKLQEIISERNEIKESFNKLNACVGKGSVYEYQQQKQSNEELHIYKNLVTKIMDKCQNFGITSKDNKENVLGSPQKYKDLYQSAQASLALDDIFDYLASLQQTVSSLEKGTEQELKRLNQLDKSNKLLLEENIHLRQKIATLEDEINQISAIQTFNNDTKRKDIDCKYSELMVRYQESQTKGGNHSQRSSDKGAKYLSVYKLKVSECRRILDEIAQAFDTQDNVVVLPAIIDEHIKEVQKQVITLQQPTDQNEWLQKNQLEEMNRFKRQLVLLLDLQGQDTPLSQIIKKARENRVMADSSLRLQKQLAQVKKAAELPIESSEQQLLEKVQSMRQPIATPKKGFIRLKQFHNSTGNKGAKISQFKRGMQTGAETL